MNIPDAYSHPLFNPDIDRATHYHTRNILCTAIKDMSGRSIAVVQVRRVAMCDAACIRQVSLASVVEA
jgi:hypothetical protein